MAAIQELMRYIEPHAHMVSRVTDDYLAMATAGCPAVCEPAFWAGSTAVPWKVFVIIFLNSPNTNQNARRAFAPAFLLALHQSEGIGDIKLAEEVMAIIPEFIDRPNVLGIGEIGLNKNSRNELKVLEIHVDLAGSLINRFCPYAASRR